MPSGSRVVVSGLRDLGKALKAAEDGATHAMRDAFKEIVQGVVTDVRGRVPHDTGKAASSYVPRASATGAGIAFGGNKAAYVPWLDFGGKVGRHKSVKRPFVQGGRYLYPAITDNMRDVEEKVGKAIDAITARYGFRVED